MSWVVRRQEGDYVWRALQVILTGGVAGAIVVVAGSFVYLEVVRPLAGIRAGGFDVVGLVLYAFGTPVGAAIGAVAGWRIGRSRQPPALPAERNLPQVDRRLEFPALPRYPR